MITRLGLACVAASLALYAWLHAVPPSSGLDWRARTLSQYALLDNGWAFDAATLLLAAGSALVLVALVRTGRARAKSSAAAMLALWVVGLAAVVAFEKHNWSAGPSIGGDIHRAASVVAFLSLPLGAILTALPWLRRDRTTATLVVASAVVALLCFSPIVWALASEPFTGVRWWRAIPLGAVERALGAAEVVTVLLLARWSLLPSRLAESSTAAAGTPPPSS